LLPKQKSRVAFRRALFFQGSECLPAPVSRCPQRVGSLMSRQTAQGGDPSAELLVDLAPRAFAFIQWLQFGQADITVRDFKRRGPTPGRTGVMRPLSIG
jgi:hypothetical protein